MTSLLSFPCLVKYSGFQQSADKCNACGHLIMDMVSVCYFPVVYFCEPSGLNRNSLTVTAT